MQVRFLGTGDAFCSGGRYQTCFLVEVNGYTFLIDCGATSLTALESGNIDINSIDSIILSHFHGDHFGGIPFLLLKANFVSARSAPLHILGPAGVDRRVGDLMESMYPKVRIDQLSYEVYFHEYSPSGNKLGPLQIESFPMVHVPESLPHGIRITAENKVLAFSGDTGWTDALYDVSRVADLFICECNFFDTSTTSHLNYQTIMAERDNFQCDNIVLNHLGPEMLKNMEKLELTSCYDGLILSV
jgi:ribonuclease BN (tRNA processing enzyme)